MLLQAYAVKDKGTDKEQRPFLGWAESIEEGRNLVRDAISSGFEYGYLKEGTATVGYYIESSFP